MPEYRVCFEHPVTYLPDHKLHRREVTDLPVRAPDEEAAKVHALRVTLGDPGTITVEALDLYQVQTEQILVRRA